ncbi:NDP-hexose 2,3-dehydratase family protein [Actinomycetospora termitidis]|uniref:NDP-hexose 2,3-dehydratase family protein n=1 Tax=Actinomycetospora termitidis TaxID=3053470 RepID=A0ABT7MD38_9PSEU|nr:NDP-hexose 2,3-dehydratase family protein [Actinomycetospora sp. Odt1-22]MDL5158584.1 NDP-hexose 2,3-dehydratase family protein [Actinomycetospora sp. Odt1-22]
MTVLAPGLAPADDQELTGLLAASAAAEVPDGGAALLGWLADHDRHAAMTVHRADLAALEGWTDDPVGGRIHHRSGRFFAVEGLDVQVPGAPVEHWQQPIIRQPEVGVLGILATRIGGVLHLLMQAKVEPGNPVGHQLSPTVQATRSNYQRAHGGRAVPYLEYFLGTVPGARTVVDVRQSEQGSWFLRKRNRNVVVEVPGGPEAVPARPGFRWCTLAEVHRALAVTDVVNMDTRTVLSCLPLAGGALRPAGAGRPDDFRAALLRSMLGESGGVHRTADLLSDLTVARTETDVDVGRVPLHTLQGWSRRDGAIVHDDGAYFSVVGVDVVARGREVARWSQPMFAAHGTGLVAFVVRRIGGVLHVLAALRTEPGFVDAVELAPTVQCTPENYAHRPASQRPAYLDRVLAADPDRLRFDTVMSEEGGRFHHTRTRYVVVEETGDDPDLVTGPGHRWVTLAQLSELVRHSHYLNVQARSLLTCLHSLALCA